MSASRLIAVFCAQEERRRSIAERLHGPESDVVPCATSDDLYRLAASVRVDAIILEQRLPGFLTGLDILARLAGELVRPVSVVLGEFTASEREQAASVKPSAVLLVDASEDSIASTVFGALVTANQGLPIPHAARMFVRDASAIQPLPQLIVQVSRFLEDPNASVGALAKVISADPRVTAELLKLVNSAAMGLSARVTRIADAVNLIGVKRTVALVLSTHLLQPGRTLRKSLPASLERRLRFRSLMMASTAATFASMTGQPAPDTAYVLALLQDLGMLTLARELGAKYQRILDRCTAVAQLQLAGYEQRELGFTHADVSAALLQNWELPTGLTRLVLLHHHRGESFDGTPEECELLQAMQVAEAFADLKDRSTPQRQMLLRRCAMKGGRLDDSGLRKCLTDAVARTQELGQLFHVPMPDAAEMQQLVEQLAAEADLPLPEEIEDTASESGLRPVRRRIVALDDDAVMLEFIQDWLHGTEFDVILGRCEDEVREPIQHADAVLCDVHLDETMGTEVLERLRAAGFQAPVVMISDDRSRGSVTRSIEAGACDYLVKPFTRDALLAKLRECVGRAADAVSA
jgi:HD-like signal output (HDOD) protein/DNA-binding response OmpR family regulator